MAPEETNVRYTNARVENWMRILKLNILRGETKLRPGDFIRKLREGVEGRTVAFEFAFDLLSSKILTTKKGSCKIKDNSLAKEIWQRRKKNKNNYFVKTNPKKSIMYKMYKTAKGGSNSDSGKKVRKAIPKLEPLDNLRHKREMKSTHSRPVRPTMKKIYY